MSAASAAKLEIFRWEAIKLRRRKMIENNEFDEVFENPRYNGKKNRKCNN